MDVDNILVIMPDIIFLVPGNEGNHRFPKQPKAARLSPSDSDPSPPLIYYITPTEKKNGTIYSNQSYFLYKYL